MNPTLPGERHISFAVNKENDSNESNHTAIMMNEDDGVVVTDGNSTSGTTERRSKAGSECKESLLSRTRILSVSVAAIKQGSITGSTGKSKLMRRSSVKLRKPSLRVKDSGKSKSPRLFSVERNASCLPQITAVPPIERAVAATHRIFHRKRMVTKATWEVRPWNQPMSTVTATTTISIRRTSTT